MGAFGLVVMLRNRDLTGEQVESFRGLSRTNPVAAAAMVVFLLSLAGIPCTAGFIGKWWLFGAAVKADYTWLAVVAVVNSAISLYYYARVVVAMYMVPADGVQPVPVSAGVRAALAIAFCFTLWIGLYPQPFIRFAQIAMLPLRHETSHRLDTAGTVRRPEQGGEDPGGLSPTRFAGLGFEIVMPVIVGVFGGRWLDGKLGTGPWLLLTGTVLGIAAGFLNFFAAVLPRGRHDSGDGEKR
jgi:formate hydrogenlyase subunit 3/multisubunit Na+/H+ antiporter MnhD subunit